MVNSALHLPLIWVLDVWCNISVVEYMALTGMLQHLRRNRKRKGKGEDRSRTRLPRRGETDSKSLIISTRKIAKENCFCNSGHKILRWSEVTFSRQRKCTVIFCFLCNFPKQYMRDHLEGSGKERRGFHERRQLKKFVEVLWADIMKELRFDKIRYFFSNRCFIRF